MSITITDAALLAQLDQSNGVVELRAPDGRLIGTFVAERFAKLPPEQRPGRPLQDVLKDLRERYGV